MGIQGRGCKKDVLLCLYLLSRSALMACLISWIIGESDPVVSVMFCRSCAFSGAMTQTGGLLFSDISVAASFIGFNASTESSAFDTSVSLRVQRSVKKFLFYLQLVVRRRNVYIHRILPRRLSKLFDLSGDYMLDVLSVTSTTSLSVSCHLCPV